MTKQVQLSPKLFISIQDLDYFVPFTLKTSFRDIVVLEMSLVRVFSVFRRTLTF